jgi:hypothetical protein
MVKKCFIDGINFENDVVVFCYGYELISTYNRFLWDFIQTIIGLRAWLLYLLSLRNAFIAVSYISILHDLRPIYVYKEWQYIDKNPIKKMAPPLLGVLRVYFVLMFGNL